MNYCPLCAAEYRESAPRCSSCGAALVSSLDDENVRSNPPRLLWIGGSGAEFDAVAGALREADIPALVEEGPARILQRLLKSESQICVLQNDLPKALETAVRAISLLSDGGAILQKCHQCATECSAALAVCSASAATLILERVSTQKSRLTNAALPQTLKYCPLCDTEYSASYERCTVCGTELVPEALRGKLGREQELKEKLEIIWRGGDPVAVSRAVSVLREAGIRHHMESTHDYFVFGLAMPRPKYIVRVLQGDAEKAKELLASIIDSPFFGAEISADFPNGTDTQVRQVAGPWNPASATAEIWTGDDSALAQLLEDCLRENRIGFRREGLEPGPLRLFVTRADEVRAREILREVREGTPPS